MSTKFVIQASDPVLLEKARRVAQAFVQPYMNDAVVGIVFLGAIVRGYFDRFADIDIAVFKKQGADLHLPHKFLKVEDLEVQLWVSDYEDELTAKWDMSRRWTYAQAQIYYDPGGKIAPLLQAKVPLQPDERKWLLMAGLTLSVWYTNDLTRLWVERGNLISAHHMFDQGLNYFFDMLFGLNHELVADMKWRYYCVAQLDRLPSHFAERIQETMLLHALSLEELDRRQRAFMTMWEEMKPIVEAEVQMTFDEMVQVV